jgi:hypothetical protein
LVNATLAKRRKSTIPSILTHSSGKFVISACGSAASSASIIAWAISEIKSVSEGSAIGDELSVGLHIGSFVIRQHLHEIARVTPARRPIVAVAA